MRQSAWTILVEAVRPIGSNQEKLGALLDSIKEYSKRPNVPTNDLVKMAEELYQECETLYHDIYYMKIDGAPVEKLRPAQQMLNAYYEVQLPLIQLLTKHAVRARNAERQDDADRLEAEISRLYHDVYNRKNSRAQNKGRDHINWLKTASLHRSTIKDPALR